MKRRIHRVIEVASLFGWTSRMTWQTIFRPFAGWDIGCGYCQHEARALAARRCARYIATGRKGGCGE